MGRGEYSGEKFLGSLKYIHIYSKGIKKALRIKALRKWFSLNKNIPNVRG